MELEISNGMHSYAIVFRSIQIISLTGWDPIEDWLVYYGYEVSLLTRPLPSADAVDINVSEVKTATVIVVVTIVVVVVVIATRWQVALSASFFVFFGHCYAGDFAGYNFRRVDYRPAIETAEAISQHKMVKQRAPRQINGATSSSGNSTNYWRIVKMAPVVSMPASSSPSSTLTKWDYEAITCRRMGMSVRPLDPTKWRSHSAKVTTTTIGYRRRRTAKELSRNHRTERSKVETNKTDKRQKEKGELLH